MKGKIFLAVLFTLVMACFSCDTGTGPGGGSAAAPSQTGTFTSQDASGNTYTLIITEKRAVYGGKAGDSFELRITSPDGAVIGTSRGTIQAVSVNGFTLKPSNSTATFSVAVGGDTMTGLSGTAITFDDGKTRPAPGSLTPLDVTANIGSATTTIKKTPAVTVLEPVSDVRFEGAWRWDKPVDGGQYSEVYFVFSGSDFMQIDSNAYCLKGTFHYYGLLYSDYTEDKINMTVTNTWSSSSWGPNIPTPTPSATTTTTYINDPSYTISGNKLSMANSVYEKIELTPFAGTWKNDAVSGKFMKFFGNAFMEITDDEDDYTPGSSASGVSPILNLDANDSAYRGTFEYNETANTITLTYTDETSPVVSTSGGVWQWDWAPLSGPLPVVAHSYAISGTPTALSIDDSENPVSGTLVLNGVQYTKIKNW